MDYDKLIERLNTKMQSYASYTDSEFAHVMEDAITAIETLRADLARMTEERVAAVADMEALMWFSGEGCRICAHAIEVHREPYVRLDCDREKGTDCSPKWRGVKEG